MSKRNQRHIAAGFINSEQILWEFRGFWRIVAKSAVSSTAKCVSWGFQYQKVLPSTSNTRRIAPLASQHSYREMDNGWIGAAKAIVILFKWGDKVSFRGSLMDSPVPLFSPYRSRLPDRLFFSPGRPVSKEERRPFLQKNFPSLSHRKVWKRGKKRFLWACVYLTNF